MRTLDDWLGGLSALVTIPPILASVSAGVLVLVTECVHWLETAVWETATLHNALEWLAGKPISTDEMMSGFKGLNQIIRWAVDTSPLSLWLIFAMPIIWLAITIPVLSFLFTTIKTLFAPLPPRR